MPTPPDGPPTPDLTVADGSATADAASGARPEPRPAALEGAAGHRDRPAHGHPRRLDREPGAAVGQGRPRHQPTPTSSGWSPPTPSPSAACCCSAAASPTTSAASAMFIIGLLGFAAASALGGIAPTAALLFAAARPAGRVRRAARPCRAVAHHRDLPRAQGARQGVRRLRRDLRRRRGARPAARRRPHRVPLVALVPAGQHPDRDRRGGARRPVRAGEPGRRRREATTSLGAVTVHARPRRARLRLHQGRAAHLHRVGALDRAVARSCGSRSRRCMLVAFFVIETRVPNPLVPMRVLLDRNRGASYLVSLIVGIGLFAMFLFLGLYLQVVLGYSPIVGGLRVPAVQRRHHRRRRHRQPAAAAGRPQAAHGPRPARGRRRACSTSRTLDAGVELLDARPAGDARSSASAWRSASSRSRPTALHGIGKQRRRRRLGRCSTPRSRSAAPSAPRCSTRSPWRPPPPTSRPTARAGRGGDHRPALTAGYTQAFLVGAGFLRRRRGGHRLHGHDRQGRGEGRRTTPPVVHLG